MARRGVAVLTGGEDEGDLVRAIDAGGEDLVVVRRCADLAEVMAAARAGVCDLAVVDGADPDLDREVLLALAGAAAGVVVVAPAEEGARLRAMGADVVVPPGRPAEVVDALHALATRPPRGTHPGTPSGGHPPGDSRSPGSPGGGSPAGGSPAGGSPAHGSPTPGYPPAPGEHGAGSPGAGSPTPGFPPTPGYPPTPGSPTPGSPIPEFPSAPGFPPAPAEAAAGGRVVAIWGTSGAPGRTTVAIEVARLALAAGSSLLVDADTAAPSVAHLLGLPTDTSGLATLCRTATRGTLDVLELARLAEPTPDGFGVLTGVSAPQRWREVTPAALVDVLGVCREVAATTVVDVQAGTLDPVADPPRRVGRDEVLAAVLRDADVVVLAVRGDAVGIARCARSLQWWEDLDSAAELVPVVTMVEESAAGHRPRNAIAQAMGALMPGRRVWIVPMDPAVRAAHLRGVPVTRQGARGPAARALVELAPHVLAPHVPAPHVPAATGRGPRRRARTRRA